MDRGRVRGVPNIVISLETFGIFENWSLRRGDRNRKFNCSIRSRFQRSNACTRGVLDG